MQFLTLIKPLDIIVKVLNSLMHIHVHDSSGVAKINKDGGGGP